MWGIFLGIFFLVMALGGRAPPYNDGSQIFAHAENVAYKGQFGIRNGAGPVFYDPRPAFVSLIHVPDVLLRRAIGLVAPAADPYTRIVTSHIVPAALTALTCLLFVRFVLMLGVGLVSAAICAGLLATATMLFVFGRTVWSDIVQATAFWGFFSEMVRLARTPTRRRALLFGMWTGILLNTKYLFVLALPGATAYLLTELRGGIPVRERVKLAGWIALAALPFGVLIAVSNFVRSGSIIHLGYGVDEPFQEAIFFGVYSLLFSFGKGLFLYNPLLIFSLNNNSRLPRRWWWACILAGGPILLLYGKYSNWGGDWSWGPRYIIWLVPVLMVPVSVWLDDAMAGRRRVLLAVFSGVAVCSIFIQLLGAGMYWDHYIRLSNAATHQWLGQPNRAGGYTPDRRRGDCSPCTEDLYGHTYLPAFQPIEGHYWILKHSLMGHTWEKAVKDAPWRRYTSLPLDVTRGWHPWPDTDFWYGYVVAKYPVGAVVLLVMLLAGFAGGCGMSIWALRWLLRAPAWNPSVVSESTESQPILDGNTCARDSA